MHILLAEDNPINQQVVQRMLGRMDHTVHTVDNGQEAVEEAGQNTYDLILMDMMMPELDGMQAARAIRAAGNPVRMIALTANATTRDRNRCLDAGMNDFLSKPFSLDDLGRTLERVPEKALVALDASTLRIFMASIGDDSSFLSELFHDFLNDAQSCRSNVHAALETGDADSVRRAMHTLKANGAIFGAKTLAGLCGALEQHAEQGDLEAVSREMDAFEDALEQVTSDIRTLMSRKSKDNTRRPATRDHASEPNQVVTG